jgi:membrane protein
VGKWLIGWYLGSSSVGSAYGAAGSLVLLLVWVYYSSLILFVGAEVTQAYARVKGQQIEPNPPAGTTTQGKPAS